MIRDNSIPKQDGDPNDPARTSDPTEPLDDWREPAHAPRPVPMGMDVWEFWFDESEDRERIQEAWSMTRAALDGLMGEAACALDAATWFERDSQVVCFDVGSEAGRAQARMFFGIVDRMFGAYAANMRRVVRYTRPRCVTNTI